MAQLGKAEVIIWLMTGISSSAIGFLLITAGKISLLLRDIALNSHSEKPKEYHSVILQLSSIDTFLGWIIIIGGWILPLLLKS